MPWAAFSTKAQWDAFHDAVCADRGIPRPGKRQSDGAVQIRNQWTNAQFEPYVVDVVINGNPRKIGIARVPQAAVDLYGLNTITDPQRNGDSSWTVTYQGQQYTVQLAADETVFPFRKPKPPTWTDPQTGSVYTTG